MPVPLACGGGTPGSGGTGNVAGGISSGDGKVKYNHVIIECGIV
jgi:hypothetical protein